MKEIPKCPWCEGRHLKKGFLVCKRARLIAAQQHPDPALIELLIADVEAALNKQHHNEYRREQLKKAQQRAQQEYEHRRAEERARAREEELRQARAHREEELRQARERQEEELRQAEDRRWREFVERLKRERDPHDHRTLAEKLRDRAKDPASSPAEREQALKVLRRLNK